MELDIVVAHSDTVLLELEPPELPCTATTPSSALLGCWDAHGCAYFVLSMESIVVQMVLELAPLALPGRLDAVVHELAPPGRPDAVDATCFANFLAFFFASFFSHRACLRVCQAFFCSWSLVSGWQDFKAASNGARLSSLVLPLDTSRCWG